jgi:hypothetical protein
LNAIGANPPRLRYVVTEDCTFLSHHCRWRAARDASFEVHVGDASRQRRRAAIEVEHFILHPIPFAARKPIAAGVQRRSPRYIVFIALFCLR